MSVIIEIFEIKAKVTNGRWVGELPDEIQSEEMRQSLIEAIPYVVNLIQNITNSKLFYAGPSIPDIDLEAANEVIKYFGQGKIIHHDKPKFDKNVIY